MRAGVSFYGGGGGDGSGAAPVVVINTDKTLTVTNQPADAKVVGDELKDLKQKQEKLQTLAKLNNDEMRDRGLRMEHSSGNLVLVHNAANHWPYGSFKVTYDNGTFVPNSLDTSSGFNLSNRNIIVNTYPALQVPIWQADKTIDDTGAIVDSETTNLIRFNGGSSSAIAALKLGWIRTGYDQEVQNLKIVRVNGSTVTTVYEMEQSNEIESFGFSLPSNATAGNYYCIISKNTKLMAAWNRQESLLKTSTTVTVDELIPVVNGQIDLARKEVYSTSLNNVLCDIQDGSENWAYASASNTFGRAFPIIKGSKVWYENLQPYAGTGATAFNNASFIDTSTSTATSSPHAARDGTLSMGGSWNELGCKLTSVTIPGQAGTTATLDQFKTYLQNRNENNQSFAIVFKPRAVGEVIYSGFTTNTELYTYSEDYFVEISGGAQIELSYLTQMEIPYGGSGGTSDVVTDATLSITGAAADAKQTGDRIQKNTDELDALNKRLLGASVDDTYNVRVKSTKDLGTFNMVPIINGANHWPFSPLTIKQKDYQVTSFPFSTILNKDNIEPLTIYKSGLHALYPVVATRTEGKLDRVTGDIVPLANNQKFYISTHAVMPYQLQDMYFALMLHMESLSDVLIKEPFYVTVAIQNSSGTQKQVLNLYVPGSSDGRNRRYNERFLSQPITLNISDTESYSIIISHPFYNFAPPITFWLLPQNGVGAAEDVVGSTAFESLKQYPLASCDITYTLEKGNSTATLNRGFIYYTFTGNEEFSLASSSSTHWDTVTIRDTEHELYKFMKNLYNTSNVTTIIPYMRGGSSNVTIKDYSNNGYNVDGTNMWSANIEYNVAQDCVILHMGIGTNSRWAKTVNVDTLKSALEGLYNAGTPAQLQMRVIDNSETLIFAIDDPTLTSDIVYFTDSTPSKYILWSNRESAQLNASYLTSMPVPYGGGGSDATITTDQTLSISGDAADAKITGDRIRDIEERAFMLKDLQGAYLTFEDGANKWSMTKLEVDYDTGREATTVSRTNPVPLGGARNITIWQSNGDSLVTAVTDGIKLNHSTGWEIYDSGYYVTDYIDVTNGTSFIVGWNKHKSTVANPEITVYAFKYVDNSSSPVYIPTAAKAHKVLNNTQTEWSEAFSLNLAAEENRIRISAPMNSDLFVYAFDDNADVTVIDLPTACPILYKAHVDVVNGTLSTDYIGLEFDGTENWTVVDEGLAGQSFIYYATEQADNIVNRSEICSHFESLTSSSVEGCSVATDGVIVIKVDPNEISSLNDFKTFLANEHANGTPVEIIYKLIEPATYNFDTTSIKTHHGLNTIWSNGVDMELTYVSNVPLSLEQIDYGSQVINKPEIDTHVLQAGNNTHESLGLISELDFVTEPTSKTTGMEFILPEGTPDDPIELSEINDDPTLKYANNYTSSNYYINTEIDDIRRILSAKMQVLVVDEMPDPPAKNTIYFVERLNEEGYDQYIIDSLGNVHSAGGTNVSLTGYVQSTRKVGGITLENDISPNALANATKDIFVTLTNKWIDGGSNTLRNMRTDIFRTGVVCDEMPATPNATSFLTTNASKVELDKKVDKVTTSGVNEVYVHQGATQKVRGIATSISGTSAEAAKIPTVAAVYNNRRLASFAGEAGSSKIQLDNLLAKLGLSNIGVGHAVAYCRQWNNCANRPWNADAVYLEAIWRDNTTGIVRVTDWQGSKSAMIAKTNGTWGRWYNINLTAL